MRNLRWAFSNFDHRIFVQTFADYGLETGRDVQVTAHRADPAHYFHFYDHLEIRWGDVVVLVQQDNLFARKVDPIIAHCLRGPIVTWDQDVYLAIYNRANKKVYPRVAEISTFMHRELVEELRSQGLSYGQHGRQFVPGGRLYNGYRPLLEHYQIYADTHLPPPHCFLSIAEFCHVGRKDTMFDVSLYCFCTGKPVTLLPPEAMVHFSNPELFHREFPECYHSVERLQALDLPGRPTIHKNAPGVALMYLLSGAYERSATLTELLRRGDQSFRDDLSELHTHAREWMSTDQFDRLNWAMDQIWPG